MIMVVVTVVTMIMTINIIIYCMLHLLLIDNSCRTTYLLNVEISRYMIVNTTH